MDEDEIKKKIKDGWLRVWCAIEAAGVNEEIVKTSLSNHIDKIRKLEGVTIYKDEFKETIEQDVKDEKQGVFKDVDKIYSQVVEINMIVKDIYTLLSVIILYGPSAVEILEPNEITLKISEVQNIANLIATLLHQFASSGAGGIVIAPK